MDDADKLLDGDLTAAELNRLLARMRDEPELRDEVTLRQLVRDAVSGVRALDDGYTLRILARIRRAGGLP